MLGLKSELGKDHFKGNWWPQTWNFTYKTADCTGI